MKEDERTGNRKREKLKGGERKNERAGERTTKTIDKVC